MAQNTFPTLSEKPHSKLGIYASILAAIPLCMVIAYLGYVVVYFSSPWLTSNLIFPPAILAYVVVPAMIPIFIGFILGVAGLFGGNRKRIFPIVGIVLAILACILWTIAFASMAIFTQ
jgi:hypothetical protein